MRNHKCTAIIVGIAFVAMTAPVAGQIIYGQPTTADLRVMYTHWSDDSDSLDYDVNQVSVPFVALVPLRENLEMHLYAANASTSVDTDIGDFDLSGFTDMRLQFNQSFIEDRLLLSAGFNLPTGTKALSVSDERPVMEMLTQNYLSFPIRRYGEGFGFNLLAGMAAAANAIRYGGTISYQVNGSYEAYDGKGDYKPGNMFVVTASADTRADQWTVAGDISFTTYSVDKVDDKNVFDQSDQFDIHGGVGYHSETYSIHGDARYMIRGRNTRYDQNEAVFDQQKIYGNEFYLSGRFAYAPDEAWFVAPLADLRVIAGDEYGFGGSNIIGLGFDAGRTVAGDFTLGAGFKYYTGNADDGSIGLSGYQFTAGLMAAF